MDTSGRQDFLGRHQWKMATLQDFVDHGGQLIPIGFIHDNLEGAIR